MHKAISLEGHSGVGKTTIAENINGAKIKRIGEFFHYLLPGEEFVTIMPQNKMELKNMRRRLFDLMLRREKDIKLQFEQNNNVIIERSPLSFIYTELARAQKGYLTDINDLCKDLYLIYSTQISNIDKYVFLNASNELSIERINNREGKKIINFFSEKNTLNIANNFLNHFKQEYLNESQFVEIDTNEVCLENTISKVREDIYKMVSFQNNIPDGIVKLCSDVVHGKDLLKELHIK